MEYSPGNMKCIPTEVPLMGVKNAIEQPISSPLTFSQPLNPLAGPTQKAEPNLSTKSGENPRVNPSK